MKNKTMKKEINWLSIVTLLVLILLGIYLIKILYFGG